MLLFVTALVVGAAPSVVGEWSLMGMPMATFNKNGTCAVAGEPCTYKVQGSMLLIVGPDGDSAQTPFTLVGDTLTLLEEDTPVVFTRIGAAPATAPTAPTATTPTAPTAPAASTNAPPLDLKDPLSQLLLSTAWCSFKYNKVSGSSSTTRIRYQPNGTWVVGARSEGYSSGAGGTFSSQTDSTSVGRWSVAKGVYWFGYPPQAPGLPPPALFPVALRVTRNSNGYPIVTSPDGTEYSQCD